MPLKVVAVYKGIIFDYNSFKKIGYQDVLAKVEVISHNLVHQWQSLHHQQAAQNIV